MSGPAVAVERVSLTLGRFALRRLDLALEPGEVLVILGPNGAGKSVSLETIAGFHRPSAGRVLIDGRDVTRLPPEQRRVGFLFQNFGLFPHLSVAQNVAFGRRARRQQDAPDPARLLAHFGISHLAGHGLATLSPGERQRVALARAMASQPALYLFDEPFSALDARSRDQLRGELRAFLRETRRPAIFVTHDEADALALADRVAVMKDGEILQLGPPDVVFRRPATEFVARFLGIENLLPGRVASGAGAPSTVAIGDRAVEAAAAAAAAAGDVLVAIRAEEVAVHAAGGPPAGVPARPAVNRFDARVVAVAQGGPVARVTLDCGFPLIACLMPRDLRGLGLAPGTSALAEFPADAVHLIRR